MKERTCRYCRGIMNKNTVDGEYFVEENPERNIYFCKESCLGYYMENQLNKRHPNWAEPTKTGYIKSSIEHCRRSEW